MPSPIGERLERFPLDADVADADPITGAPWRKRSSWSGGVLTTVASDVAGAQEDIVTSRYIDDEGRLIQTTRHGSASFVRVFARRC